MDRATHGAKRVSMSAAAVEEMARQEKVSRQDGSRLTPDEKERCRQQLIEAQIRRESPTRRGNRLLSPQEQSLQYRMQVFYAAPGKAQEENTSEEVQEDVSSEETQTLLLTIYYIVIKLNQLS